MLSPSGGSVMPLVGPGTAAPDFKLSHPILPNPGPTPSWSGAPVGLQPKQIRHAYKIDQITLNGGVTGDGTGQTIAIIDAYDHPTIATDLAQFDATLGVAAPPSFTKVAQDGSTNYPPVDSSGGWEIEEALDVEWSHAIAPAANIILVEASDNSFSNLNAGVDWARSHTGVVAISMSYGGGEFQGENSYDTYFTTPAGHAGVTFLASTGDGGAPPEYPAISPNIVGVGGTTLTIDGSNNYVSERGWSGSGGGISSYESQPSYQNGVVTQSTTMRTNPDVSLDADPNSGVAIRSQYNGGVNTPWLQVGGTSFSSPAWAGLIAIADQGRSLLGLSSFDGPSGTLPGLYHLPSSDFHDITTGNNGYPAGPGYDLVTGRGTPIANTLIPDLVQPSSTTHFSVTSSVSTTTAGTTFSITVTALDSSNHTDPTYVGTVHFTSSDSTAVLPANYTFVATDAGAHTFTVTLKKVGSQTITAADTANNTVTGQVAVTVTAATTSTLTVAGFTSPATAGASGNFTVTAKDAFGNTTTGYTGTVHFTSSDPAAVLPADYTFVAGDNGSHSFGATLKTSGSRSITATDKVSAGINGSQNVTVNAAAASTLVVSGFASPATAGVAHTLTVTARDTFGNTATGYRGTIHFTSSDPQATLPANYAFVAGDAGVHSFSVTLKTAGTESLTAADTVTGTITGGQTGITVNAAAASTLTVSGFASPATAGVAGTLTVTAKDAFGNIATSYAGTVHFTSSDPQATLPGNYTFVAGNAGVHSFSVTLKTAGTESLTATDTVTGTITGSQSGITVNAAAASTLTVNGFASPATAGVAGTLTVTAKDAFGNTARSYLGTVHFASSDAQATVPGNYTFAAADNGVHSFSVTLKTAGTQSLTATDTLTSTIAGSQTGITVNAAAASTLSVGGFPATTTAGVAGTLSVTAKDAFGNTATSYLGTVFFTSSDSQAALPGNYAFVVGDNGVHSFSVTLKTAGTQSLTATDSLTSTIAGSQAGITVNAATASTLSLAGFPSSTTAGVAHSFTVRARDAFGNTAAGYLGTVHFTSTDPQATLPADYTFVVGDNAVHSFSATFNTAGTQSLTATDTVAGTITGTETGIVVSQTQTTASAFVVTGFASPATAGVAQTFTVTAKDSSGNTVSNYTGTVHFTSSDAQATLPADYTFTLGDAGVHTFTATLKTAGNQGLTATDRVTTSITGTQSGITITAAAASTLIVAGFPSPITAGVAGNFTVTARDAFGNTATGYLGTIHFTSSDAQATLPANYTFVVGDSGVHTFSVTLKTAGSQALTATDTVTGTITGTQAGISVSPAAASALTLTGFPSTTTAGVGQAFTVIAKDPFGNTATAYAGNVHFTSSDAQAVLPANYSFVAGDSGMHSFTAALKTAGTQSLTVSDTATTSITGSLTGITVTAAAASTLTLTGFPSSSTAGTSGTVTVTAKDAFGNTAKGYRGTVHFTSSDAQATLPANYTFTAADNGLHGFSVTLKTAGSQSITATDTVGLTITGTQGGLTVTPGSVSSFVVAGFPSPVTAGVAGSITVTAKDFYGNTVTSFTGTMSFFSSDGKAVLPGNYAFTAADNGVHVFSGVIVKTAGTQSITVLSSWSFGSQTGIVVQPAAASAFRVAGYPSSTTVGAAHTFTVTVVDAYGNTATGYTGHVHFTSTDAAAGLPIDYTFTAGDSGVHTFSATFNTRGTQSLTVTDTAAAGITGTESGIQVSFLPAGVALPDNLEENADSATIRDTVEVVALPAASSVLDLRTEMVVEEYLEALMPDRDRESSAGQLAAAFHVAHASMPASPAEFGPAEDSQTVLAVLAAVAGAYGIVPRRKRSTSGRDRS